jgi:Glycoside Hydrolase 20C C-terminal domain
MVDAYKSANAAGSLAALVDSDLKPLRESLDTLWTYHRDNLWLQVYKPFGLEIIEMRYATIRSRLATMEVRIAAHCESIKNGSRSDIPEFEADFSRCPYEG